MAFLPTGQHVLTDNFIYLETWYYRPPQFKTSNDIFCKLEKISRYITVFSAHLFTAITLAPMLFICDISLFVINNQNAESSLFL